VTHRDADDYSRKHAPDQDVDKRITQDVQAAAKEGKISCSAVFKVVSDLGVHPLEVGKAVDLLNAKLVKCQLGLFGYSPQRSIVKPAEQISPEMAAAIRSGCVDGGLSCSRAFEIAEELRVKRMDVSSAAEAMQVKIKPCQLGAF